MAKAFAIHGSTTNHGGVVMATQMRSSQMGNLFLRAGDGFACPKCQCWSTLIKSNDHVIVDGKAVAYVGDKFSCGAILMPKQVHVVGESGSHAINAFLSQFQNTENSQYQLNNHFSENKARYENYYIERDKTEYVQFKNILPPYEPDRVGRRGGGVLLQMSAGACHFVVTYNVKETKLFVSVSYLPPVLSREAKITPSASLKLMKNKNREQEFIGSYQLIKGAGYWDLEKGQEPVGFCHIQLPEPDLSLITVELTMGYIAKLEGGNIVPVPSQMTHTFTLNSAARKLK